MKKIMVLIGVFTLITFKINAQVGVGTTSPYAQLDIKSSNQVAPNIFDGVLIPKVDLFSATNPTSLQQGMLVYLTTATTFSGNPKPIGFYYWNFPTLDWIGITTSANVDADWYEVGSTIPPDAITDNMFHTGNVAIGKNTAIYPLEINTTNLNIGLNNTFSSATNNAINKIGVSNSITGSSDDTNYGIYNTINNSGSGNHFGNYTSISSPGSGVHSASEIDISGAGNGGQYGVSTTITNTGNGTHYGNANRLSTTGSGDQYASYNILGGTGTGIQYGNYISITNSGANTQYASYNILSGNGFGGHTGNYNLLSGSSGGIQTGTYNSITNTAGSSHYGAISNLSGTGAATKYGFYATISSFAGGTHYGMYSDATGAGNFSGYFLGNVAIGSTTLNTYTLPPSRGTNLQVMLTDAIGNVTWQNASAIHDNDWYKSGTVVGPTAITDDMYHTGKVGIGVTIPNYSLDISSAGRAINSITTSATNSGLMAFNSAASGASAGHGILGQTSQSGGQGIRGEQLNAGGFGALGVNFGASGASGGGGVYAQTTQSNGFGTDSRNLNANGTGVFGIGNNVAGNYLIAGSGAAFNGVITGAYARSTTAGIGEGLYTDQFGAVTRVNYWSGAAQYKIIGTGTVSTTAENLNGDRVTLHCTETPEILFEDYGQGQLTNGTTHIEIDPILAKNIIVNEKHPLRVFIQLEDNCNGVFVTNKTATSFDVIELASGHSNAKFQYHIIGNRIDELLPNGRVSKNSDLRFEPAPVNRETTEVTKIDTEKPTR
ncbi:hypothetical protein OX283_011650 [Flavobacterium sp. SUN052]|uniref:hypothetical protein n=1 Tax=Flavobacterium sp. SUN052 TaxID=3002441 RepID=UPI00237E599F|nr:hypothetical protein [Flavobacterium sp. SUN052]MEC4005312.1 hypothetical protein [Flavobacterium sp. SUN052]